MAQEPGAEPGRRVELKVLGPSQGVRVWEHALQVQAWLGQSFALLDDETMESAAERIENGTYQLWLVSVDRVVAAAALTEIVAYPTGAVLEVRHLGGSRLDDWLETAVGIVTSFARHMSCRAIQVTTGREGWARKLRSLGADKRVSTCRWELKLDG